MSTYRVADRVKETSTSTGSGSFSLAGAPTGFQTFNIAVGTNVYFTYAIVHQTLTEWEVGLGYLSGSTTLVRDTIFNSSSGGAVSFSAGTKDVFITQPANWGVTDNVVLGNSNNFVLGTTGSTQIGANTANSTQSVTIGYNASTAGGSSSVAVGYNSAASAVVGVAVGASSNAQNTSVAVGGGATGNATDTVAIGYSANASSTDGVAVGRSANVSAASGVAIGRSASVTSSSGIAIGPSTTVANGFGIAIGTNNSGTGQYGINIGRGNTPTTFNQNEISIGNSIASTANYSISIGNDFTGGSGFSVGIVPYGATSWPSIAGSQAVGIGSNIFASSTAVAIGDSALASSQDVAIGHISGTEAPSLAGSQNIAIGYAALTGGGTWNTTYSTAIGYSATVRNSGGNNIAIGRNAAVQRTNPSYNVDSSIALGYGSSVLNSTNTVVIGNFANTFGDGRDFSVALGPGAVVVASRAVAIGFQATAGDPGGYPSNDTIAIGWAAQARAANAIVIGRQSTVPPPYDNSIVIGNNTNAAQANAVYFSNFRTGISPVGTQYTLKWDNFTREVVADSGGGGGATLAKCTFELQFGNIFGNVVNNNVAFINNTAPGVWVVNYTSLLSFPFPYNGTPAAAVCGDNNSTPFDVRCEYSATPGCVIYSYDFAGNRVNAPYFVYCNFMVPA